MIIQSPELLNKVVHDMVYEVELYPKFLYFSRVTEKGEKPHQKAIVNQNIDVNYLKKTLKTTTIPFSELYISRKATFEDLLKIISTHYKENPKRGRLWIEEDLISGARLSDMIENVGMSMGQVVYVEYALPNNSFPTDKNIAATKTKDAPKQNEKTKGLYNLGNTCYMNSALQCLANTKFFSEYFVNAKSFQKQMNMKNPMGFQGELAKEFANLMTSMYQGSSVVFPRTFKATIGNVSDQFAGFEQQDSQEFLSFLLDGLHEELNLR